MINMSRLHVKNPSRLLPSQGLCDPLLIGLHQASHISPKIVTLSNGVILP
jgi:hypothetical protein